MKTSVKFRMVAFTGAAGKFDPTAPMGGNEDNFYVDDNLSDDIPSHIESDKVLDLAAYGLIMAVADGMGGQNAGEVASDIAVKTVQEFFSPGKLTDQIANSPESRKKYLEKVVVEADNRIKEEAKVNAEHEGMGSTIILAWIVEDKLTLTWCGDSRAYRFNPLTGIELLSRDHSYVQELVNKGIISYEDTFDHPQGNIVTRSLGDKGSKAEPETRQFDLYNNDIILLCSDGLSGVLRDKKTLAHNGEYYEGENIEDTIRNNCTTMKQCKDALWDAAERADWYDNITILLCNIVDGAKDLKISEPNKRTGIKNQKPENIFNRTITNIHVTLKNLIVSLLILAFVVAAVCYAIKNRRTPVNNTNETSEIKFNEAIPIPSNFDQKKEELLSRIQNECTDYMAKKNITIDHKYFSGIKDSIGQISDSSSYFRVRNIVNEFIKETNKQLNEQNSIKDSEHTEKENFKPESASEPTEDNKLTPINGEEKQLPDGSITDTVAWDSIKKCPEYRTLICKILPERKIIWKEKGYEYKGMFTKDTVAINSQDIKQGEFYLLKYKRIKK